MRCHVAFLLLSFCLVRPASAQPLGGAVGRVAKFQRDLACAKARADVDAETFVRSFIAVPPSEVCGHWVTEYAALHKSIRQGSAPKRFLTFDNPDDLPKDVAWNYDKPGLGDYLNGIVTAFLTALVTRRAFVMESSPLTDVIEPSAIDWVIRDDVPLQIDENTVVSVRHLNYGKTWKDCVNFPTDIVEHFAKHEAATTVRVRTNGGILTRVFRRRKSATYKALHAHGLRFPSAFGCILRFVLKPKAEVWRSVLPQIDALRQPSVSPVCIHVRTTDKFAFRGLGRTMENVWGLVEKGPLQCAKDIEEFSVPEGQSVRWLFLSDAQALRQKVWEEYPSQVLQSPVKPSHPKFSSNGMGSVLAEWLLFATCDYYIVGESGFAKTSVAYNLRSLRMYLFDHFNFAGLKGQCDQGKPNSLLDFWRWSGL